MTTAQPPNSLEAKIVVLGAQGVGKTSLVSRFINPHLPLSSTAPPSTIGASFVTKRVTDPDTATTVRLQIWDTPGQERFRPIPEPYYRGAHRGWLCYDITAERSIEEVFRVIARRLIEQRNRRWEREHAHTPRGGGSDGAGDDYFGGMNQSKNGSFRVGYGDKRRSWLGLPTVAGLGIGDDGGHSSYAPN